MILPQPESRVNANGRILSISFLCLMRITDFSFYLYIILRRSRLSRDTVFIGVTLRERTAFRSRSSAVRRSRRSFRITENTARRIATLPHAVPYDKKDSAERCLRYSLPEFHSRSRQIIARDRGVRSAFEQGFSFVRQRGSSSRYPDMGVRQRKA